MKRTICLDFDGVVHSYESPWINAYTIPDPPVAGALEFMLELLERGYDVVIHSSRARHILGIWAMRRWLKHHADWRWDIPMSPSLCQVRFTRFKPSAILTIDDRGWQFHGRFPMIEMIEDFRPWNRIRPGRSKT